MAQNTVGRVAKFIKTSSIIYLVQQDHYFGMLYSDNDSAIVPILGFGVRILSFEKSPVWVLFVYHVGSVGGAFFAVIVLTVVVVTNAYKTVSLIYAYKLYLEGMRGWVGY